MKKPVVKCPWCQGTKTQRRGDFPKTRYQCQSKDCMKWFYLENTKFPIITVLDIETLPIHARTWKVGKTVLSPDNVIKDWCVLSYAYKRLFSPEIKGDVLTPKEVETRNDKRLMEGLWKVLDESNIVIAHNGLAFDIPKINTRLIKHGLPPPSRYHQIDTLIAAQKSFKFTSNKLDFIGNYLGVGRKIKTEYQLWIRCDEGEKSALQEMLTYNLQDVGLLEDVYVLLRPWTPTHPNMSLYVHDEGGDDVCKVCLSDNIDWVGEYFTNASVYMSYTCNNCGAHGRRSKRKRTNNNR